MIKKIIKNIQYKIYRKVQMEFYIEDARFWCECNHHEYDEILVRDMADYVNDRFDCNIAYWDNFSIAYELYHDEEEEEE